MKALWTCAAIALAGASLSVDAIAKTGDSYRTNYVAADQAAARAALLRSSDRDGVVRTTPSPADLAPRTCSFIHPRGHDLVITGVAKSEGTGFQGSSSVVKVFRTARMARADFKRSVLAPAAERCWIGKLASGFPHTEVLGRISFPPVAPRVVAFRANGIVGSGRRGAWDTVYIVVLVKGRTEVELTLHLGDLKCPCGAFYATPYARRIAARIST